MASVLSSLTNRVDFSESSLNGNTIKAESISDDVAFLRAAALRTKRGKKRKRSDPPSDQVGNIAHQFSDNSASLFQLDYGSNRLEGNEDKEEGEISEEEDAGNQQEDFPRTGRNHLNNPSFIDLSRDSIDSLGFSEKSREGHSVSQCGSHTPQERTSQHPAERTPQSYTSDSLAPSLTMPSTEFPARPNLQMTNTQLWEAKLIILDLLGWGVTPSYLLDCGLTREAIYYVFTELNLRLPENFPVDDFQSFGERVAENGELEKSSALQLVNERGKETQAHGLKNLVDLEEDTYFTVSPSEDFAKSSNFPPLEESTSPAPSMIAIENMRRMELLARKAAMASRRTKSLRLSQAPQEFPQGSTTTSLLVDDAGTAEVEQVNSFLDSIAPAPTQVISTSVSLESPQPLQLDTSPASGFPQPLLVDSNTLGDSERFARLPLPRRSSRRPVASDFVDLSEHQVNSSESEVSPVVLNRPTGSAWTGVSSGGSTPLFSSTGKGLPSFANVGSVRRCVIDVSDDEDSGGIQTAGQSEDDSVLAKEAEIRRLREKLERLKSKKTILTAKVTTVGLGREIKEQSQQQIATDLVTVKDFFAQEPPSIATKIMSTSASAQLYKPDVKTNTPMRDDEEESQIENTVEQDDHEEEAASVWF